MLDRTIQPEIKSLDEFNALIPERLKFPNGVPVNVLNVGDKEIVRIDFVFDAGRWHQEHKLQALFTNNMLREGTASMTAAEIAEKLDFYGAWLDLSVSVSHAFVTLYSLNKYLEHTLDVLESMLKEPIFPEKELDVKVSNNLQQYYIGLKKTNVLAQKMFQRVLYGAEHPFGVSAEEEDYRQVNPLMLKAFFDSFYHSQNCTIFVSGKVSEACLEMIRRRFGDAPFGKPQEHPVHKTFEVKTAEEKCFFVEQPESSQSSVRMGMVTLDGDHPDFFKLRVLITLFGGYFGSRLMSNIREDKGYTYGISAGVTSYPTTPALVIGAETTPEFVKPLITEVYHEIDNLQQELVSEDELDMVRNYMIGDMCRNCESAFSWADAWIYASTLDLPDTYFSDFFKAIKDTSAEDIRQLAQRDLCIETLKEVVSGKKMS